MQVMVQFIAFVDATAFRGLLAYVLDVLAGFSMYLGVGWFALWQEFGFGDFRKDSPTLRRVPSVLRKVRFLGLGQSRF